MRVAITCPASLPATQFGGILFLAVDIARELSKIGNKMIIYTTDLDFGKNTSKFNRNLPRIEKIDNFEIKRSHVYLKIMLYFVNPGMYNQIINDRPELIHAIGIRGFQSLVAALVSKKLQIPLIISDQGGLYTHPDYQNDGMKKLFYRLQEPLIKFIINQSTMIIAANEYEKKIFSKYCESSKITTINNGIDVSQIEKPTIDFRKKYDIDKKFILFVGRFSMVKGIDLLLDAFAKIMKNCQENIDLVIMGADFGYRKDMLNKIKSLHLGEHVKVIEKPPREDVIAAYHSCEFLVLPSRWEMSPLTPLEGFACKKPTISINHHGIPYVIQDNKTGLLCVPDDVDDLSDKITRLLNNPDIVKKMGECGYNIVKNEYNSQKMAENVLAVYQNTLQLGKHN